MFTKNIKIFTYVKQNPFKTCCKRTQISATEAPAGGFLLKNSRPKLPRGGDMRQFTGF